MRTLFAERKHLEQQYLKIKSEFSHLKKIQTLKEASKSVASHTIQPVDERSEAVPTLRLIASSGRRFEALNNKFIQPQLAWKNFVKHAKKQKIKVHRNLQRQQLMAVEVTEEQFEALMLSDGLDYIAIDEIAYVDLSDSVAFVGADQVHLAGYTGQSTAVAILDTGVDNTHPFFAGRIVEEACFSSGNGASAISTCPSGETRQFGPGAADDCTDRFTTWDCRHGTHVAGIAAGYSSPLFSGMAPGADIIAVQVFTYFPSSGRLGAYTSDQVAALDWLLNDAQTPNIVSANMSLGGSQWAMACDASYPQSPVIAALREQGIVTVIASGNDGFNGYVSAPGCISSAVTVGSTYKYADSLSSFSNSSTLVDLLAPGSSIYSAVPGGAYSYMSGTSMATPHVAGAFASLKSLVPDANVSEIEQALKDTGVGITDVEANVTMPRIDLLAAYNFLLDGDEGDNDGCAVLPGVVTGNGGVITQGQTKSWQAIAPSGGLYRFTVDSNAVSSSEEAEVSFGSATVVISLTAGTSSIVDFPGVVAGENTLTIRALSSELNIGAIEAQQLTSNGVAALAIYPLPVPGVISENVGEIVQTQTSTWSLANSAQQNIRFSLISTSAIQSREIALGFNGITIHVSMDPGFITYIDFADVSPGDKTLSITAINEAVSLGKLEASSY